MPIDYSRLRSLTARHLIRALHRDGFGPRRQRYVHPDVRRVTVPYHRASGTFRVKTLSAIIEEQAHWTEDDLQRLGLLLGIGVALPRP